MNVEVEEATEDAEQLVCRAARNDYEDRWIGDLDFEEAMDEISPADEVPEEAYEAYYAEEFHKWDEVPTNSQRRMWTLLTHLMEHGHFGPFEHPHITFRVKGVSRSLMAQITRHRHVSFDIQSMRYVEIDGDPEPGEAVVEIPALDDPGLTGRNAEFADVFNDLDDDEVLEKRNDVYEEALQTSFMAYQELLDLGVPAQDARMVLPIGTKVNMVFTLNARMLMHVADMRAAADAQWEIREMTEAVLEKAAEWMPMTFYYYEQEMKNRKNRLAP